MVQLYCGTVVLVLGGELKVVFWQGFESLRLCCWWGGGSGGQGVVQVFYWQTPVVARVLGMSFRVFSGLEVGLGLQVDSPHRIPTNSQVILSGHHLNEHLEQLHFTVRIYRQVRSRGHKL